MARGGEWLERIREFQEAMLPGAVTSSAHADVEAAFKSVKGQLSGDFYDCIQLEGADAYVIGDVTGHGLPSALVVSVLYGAVRTAFRYTRDTWEVLAQLHALLAQLGERGGGPRLFSASLFVGVLEADGRLRYSNAGHPSPLLLRRTRRAEPLPPTSAPLGLVAPGPSDERRLQMAPGDRLLMYTDGVLPAGAMPDDLRQEIDRFGPAQADVLVRHVIEDGVDDDRTAVLVTFRGTR